MSDSPHVKDADTASFQTAVIERSKQVPVVVDFWASWCGPCRTLGPVLEQAVDGRNGQVELVKVDVDANQQLAQQFRVQGIPAVKAFRDGAVVDEFTGAQPPQQVEAFLDRLVPTEADLLVRRAREADGGDARVLFEQALAADPTHSGAAIGLAQLVVADDPERALELIRPHRPHPDAEAVAAQAELGLTADVDVDGLRARVTADDADGEAHLQLGRALAARQDYPDAIEHLLAAVRTGGDAREPAREQLLGLFQILGDGHPLVAAARPRLASALF